MKPKDEQSAPDKAYRSTSNAAFATITWLFMYVGILLSGNWLHMKSIDNTITLGDAASLILIGDCFDSKSYSSYVDEFIKNDIKAIEDFDRIRFLSSSTTNDIVQVSEESLNLYEQNIKILKNIDNLKPFSSVHQKEVDYLNKYNSLRIEYFTSIRTSAQNPNITEEDPNYLRSIELAREIDELNATRNR